MSFKTNFHKYVNEHSKVINSLEKISPKINKVIKKFFDKIIYFKEVKLSFSALDQLVKSVYKYDL